MSVVVQVQGLSKSFGNQPALKQVSLEIPAGSVFALLGENGAGKSTLIKVLLGLESPDQGATHVLGQDSRRDSDRIRKQVGYVPERPALYEWMTVEEIGWFTSGFYPPGFLERYMEQVQAFGLPTRQRLRSLSKGMRAKVMLALALGHNPELLILDEPTSGLDTLVRREFLESMVERAADGKTVLISSHQIHEVERVADEVAILHQGQLVVCDRLEKLKTEVEQWTVAFDDAQGEPPRIPGELLRQRMRSRQWQLTVRNVSEAERLLFERHVAVKEVERRTPTLEEIFVAFVAPESETTASFTEFAPSDTASPNTAYGQSFP